MISNLFIDGCQKCGTTYLHECIVKTGFAIEGSKKEMHFFNKPSNYIQANLSSYLSEFRGNEKIERECLYTIDSSTSYFQLPKQDGRDAARALYSFNPESIHVVLFRNPIERYESAFNHHILWKRVPYIETINHISSENMMLELGNYARILCHWKRFFPNINIVFYDDLKHDPLATINELLSKLNIPSNLTKLQIDFRANDSSAKLAQQRIAKKRAILSHDARQALLDYYYESIKELEKLVQRDLTSWLQ